MKGSSVYCKLMCITECTFMYYVLKGIEKLSGGLPSFHNFEYKYLFMFISI